MNLKQRLALFLSLAFALLFGVALLFIYSSFSTFRTQEFADRLEEKALTTVRLLTKVKEVDPRLLKIIDRNSLHKLYNEKTMVFDTSYHLIYNSADNISLKWDLEDLKTLKNERTFFRQHEEKELFGLFYESNQGKYYVLIAAEDKYGFSKLHYLAYTLLGVFLVGIILVGAITYFIVFNLVKPLDILQQKISDITVKELNTQLPESHRKDEINLLSKSFNQMLRRIEKAYIAQREFTSNASHELLTPISRLTTQLDNLIQLPHSEITNNYLKNIINDVNQMGDLVQSLLILVKTSKVAYNEQLKTERIDEIIFGAYSIVKKQFPDFQMGFDIVENQHHTPNLEVKAMRSLLEIAFVNLFKNACLYSDSHKINIEILQMSDDEPLQIKLENTGEPIKIGSVEKDKIASMLFESFVRGSNSQHISGSGLGLRIVKRILDFQNAQISYSFTSPNLHRFLIVFEPQKF